LGLNSSISEPAGNVALQTVWWKPPGGDGFIIGDQTDSKPESFGKNPRQLPVIAAYTGIFACLPNSIGGILAVDV
jgi:hypothetical protein